MCVCECVCVCAGVSVCRCVGVSVRGCVGVWVCGCVGVWVCGCVGVCIEQLRMFRRSSDASKHQVLGACCLHSNLSSNIWLLRALSILSQAWPPVEGEGVRYFGQLSYSASNQVSSLGHLSIALREGIVDLHDTCCASTFPKTT